MALIARVEMLSERGPVRGNNEDSLGSLAVPETRPGIEAVYAVADGLGGHELGEVASAMAVSLLLESFLHDAPHGPPADSLEAELAATLQRISLAVSAFGVSGEGMHRDPAAPGMATTLTAAVLKGRTLHLGHVGDSRAYLIRGPRLTPLTEDHSVVADRVRRGLLRPEDAHRHPERNVLTQVVGMDRPIRPFTASQAVEAGDRVLLCTDGLHGFLDDQAMADTILGTPDGSIADALVARAIAAGSDDNVTVLLVSFGEPEGGDLVGDVPEEPEAA